VVENHPTKAKITPAYCLLPARTKILNVDELKRRIKNEWADLNHAANERAVGKWRQRLGYTRVLRAGDGHFEHIM